jgi:hypothetical protein
MVYYAALEEHVKNAAKLSSFDNITGRALLI